jgi:hypothetical protein
VTFTGVRSNSLITSCRSESRLSDDVGQNMNGTSEPPKRDADRQLDDENNNSHPEFRPTVSDDLLDHPVLTENTQAFPATKTVLSINALQIHLDNSDVSSTPTASPLGTPFPSSNDISQSLSPSPRVRFRSRVRITSGLHRSRNKSRDFNTPRSSVSGSPSSSISAPLRTHTDATSTAWGPLGQRVSSPPWKKRDTVTKRLKKDRRQNRPLSGLTNERTPLIGSGRILGHGNGESAEGRNDADGSNDERLAREVDLFFGSWPQRLLNLHVSSVSSLHLLQVPIFLPVVVVAA